jgi:hypothetical protein
MHRALLPTVFLLTAACTGGPAGHPGSVGAVSSSSGGGGSASTGLALYFNGLEGTVEIDCVPGP